MKEWHVLLGLALAIGLLYYFVYLPTTQNNSLANSQTQVAAFTNS
jgi:hypothetical protein